MAIHNFLRRLNMTWWEEKWWDRLTRCPWTTKVTQQWKGKIYFKEVLNKAFPGETRECQFHYIKSWWNLSWTDRHRSGHPGSRRVNSHLTRCTGRPQRCSGTRKFPCGTAAITISAMWGCGKTLALLSLIPWSSSQCREDLKETVYFSLAGWGLLSRNTSEIELKGESRAIKIPGQSCQGIYLAKNQKGHRSQPWERRRGHNRPTRINCSRTHSGVNRFAGRNIWYGCWTPPPGRIFPVLQPPVTTKEYK